MPRHFLAACLLAFAACALCGILPAAVLAARALHLPGAVLAAAAGLGTAAVLANAAADLWAAA
jgi:hypothetical protein